MPGAEVARPEAKSAGRRAIVALVLWLGFYGLGLGFAGLLLALPWAQLEYQNDLGISGVLCAVGAVTVLWAIFPWIELFRPPSEAIEPGHPSARGGARARPGPPRRPSRARRHFLDPRCQCLRRPAQGLAAQATALGRGIGLFLFDVLDREELASVVTTSSAIIARAMFCSGLGFTGSARPSAAPSTVSKGRVSGCIFRSLLMRNYSCESRCARRASKS